jgi:hypothetical protein
MSNRFVSPAEIGELPDTYAFEQTGFRTRKATMAWQGSAGDAARSLASVVADNPDSSRRYRNPLRFIGLGHLMEPSTSSTFWQPGRLMRSIIDSHTVGQTRIDLVNQAARFALRFYAHGDGQEQLQDLRESMLGQALLHRQVKQTFDQTTLRSTQINKTEAAAKRLLDKTTDDVFMVPICHGGFVAGVQMALQYRRLNPDGDMSLYPIRYSRDKMSDIDPRIFTAELDHIREGAQDRTVVVFDEDAYSGHSVGCTVQKLQTALPGHEVLGLVSNDARYYVDAETQGLWWEHYTKPSGK